MKRLLVILIVVTFSSVYSQTNPMSRELDYYPLSSGNYFEYKSLSWQMPYPADSSAYSIKVLGDTTLENGKRYKILHHRSIPRGGDSYYDYERIDSLTGSVYRYKNNNSYKNNEYMMDSIFARVGDTIRCSRNGFSSFGYFRTICISIHLDTLLGFPTEVKEFRDQSFIPGLGYKLAKGLGFFNSFACEFSCSSTSLVYAKIDGKIYGKTITSINIIEPNIPINFKLYQNYPSPFNPSTTIKFAIPSVRAEHVQPLHVVLKVFDLLGRVVATLVNEEKAPGNYEVKFDGSNYSSGVYFYQLIAGDNVITKKFVLMK